MNIHKKYIENAVQKLGFKAFTEIQEKVIPVARKGEDIIGCSQTGSGKTHAFLIPIFENLDLSSDALEVVITSPTRELANQIYRFAKQIAEESDLPIDIRQYTGGSNRNKELERLEKSQPKNNLWKSMLITSALIGSFYLGEKFTPITSLQEKSFYHNSSIEDGYYQNPTNLEIITTRNCNNYGICALVKRFN